MLAGPSLARSPVTSEVIARYIIRLMTQRTPRRALSLRALSLQPRRVAVSVAVRRASLLADCPILTSVLTHGVRPDLSLLRSIRGAMTEVGSGAPPFVPPPMFPPPAFPSPSPPPPNSPWAMDEMTEQNFSIFFWGVCILLGICIGAPFVYIVCQCDVAQKKFFEKYYTDARLERKEQRQAEKRAKGGGTFGSIV